MRAMPNKKFDGVKCTQLAVVVVLGDAGDLTDLVERAGSPTAAMRSRIVSLPK